MYVVYVAYGIYDIHVIRDIGDIHSALCKDVAYARGGEEDGMALLWIEAKYDGRCTECHRKTQEGDSIVYDTDAACVFCEECGDSLQTDNEKSFLKMACRNILPPSVRHMDEALARRASNAVCRECGVPRGSSLKECMDAQQAAILADPDARAELAAELAKHLNETAPDDVCAWARLPHGSTFRDIVWARERQRGAN